MNYRTIGAEVVNWGVLREVNGELRCWPPWDAKRKRAMYQTPYKGPEPVFHQGQLWAPFTDPQIESCVTFAREVVQRFPKVARDAMQGHRDVAPNRKVDPGDAFPMQSIRERVFDVRSVAKFAPVQTHGGEEPIDAPQLLRSLFQAVDSGDDLSWWLRVMTLGFWR